MPRPGGNYEVIEGDTLQRIAAAAYGLASEWKRIALANGVQNPDLIFPGQVLYIPPEEGKEHEEAAKGAEAPASGGRRAKKEGALVVIEGRELPSKQGRFACGIDVLAPSWNAEIPWMPGRDPELDRITARGSFAKAELYLEGEPACTGRLYSRENSISAAGITKNLEFFSLTADLVDSHIPPAMNEIRNVTVKQAAEALLAANGFPVTFLDPPGKPFETVEREQAETPAKYLQRLASMRGLFVSGDEGGGVVFQKAASGGIPCAFLEFPGRRALSWTAKFDDRLRFAKYFASSQAEGGEPLNAFASDPEVPLARQLLFEDDNADASNIQEAAEWKMLRIELEAFSVSLPVPGWLDGEGNLWKPNKIVRVKSPVLGLPEPRNFAVRQAEFTWGPSGREAVLTLMPLLTCENGKLKIGG